MNLSALLNIVAPYNVDTKIARENTSWLTTLDLYGNILNRKSEKKSLERIYIVMNRLLLTPRGPPHVNYLNTSDVCFVKLLVSAH